MEKIEWTFICTSLFFQLAAPMCLRNVSAKNTKSRQTIITLGTFKNSKTLCKLTFPAGSTRKSPRPFFLFQLKLFLSLHFFPPKPIQQNNLKLGILKAMGPQAVKGNVFSGFCCSIKQPITTLSYPTMCSSLDQIFRFILLTNRVHNVWNNCKPLHLLQINIHDGGALGEQNIWLKYWENSNFQWRQ